MKNTLHSVLTGRRIATAALVFAAVPFAAAPASAASHVRSHHHSVSQAAAAAAPVVYSVSATMTVGGYVIEGNTEG